MKDSMIERVAREMLSITTRRLLFGFGAALLAAPAIVRVARVCLGDSFTHSDAFHPSDEGVRQLAKRMVILGDSIITEAWGGLNAQGEWEERGRSWIVPSS